MDAVKDKQPFTAPKFKCKICGAVIYSKYPGHFASCDCPQETFIAVDYTRYYGRHIGDPDQFEEYKE